MTEPTPKRTQPPSAAPPTRWQRISAFAFIGAFGLTILTVILTGLAVRNPASRRAPDTDLVTLAVAEPHTVNLLFNSLTQVEGVRFTLDLPAGIELNGRAGVPMSALLMQFLQFAAVACPAAASWHTVAECPTPIQA